MRPQVEAIADLDDRYREQRLRPAAMISIERVIALIEDGVFWECCSCDKCDVDCHAVDTKASKENLLEAIRKISLNKPA